MQLLETDEFEWDELRKLSFTPDEITQVLKQERAKSLLDDDWARLMYDRCIFETSATEMNLMNDSWQRGIPQVTVRIAGKLECDEIPLN